MDPIEQKLAEMKLAVPSDRLDQRIAETFRVAQRAGRRTHPARLWWWIGATTTAGVAATILVLASRRPAQINLVPVVYHIEAQAGLREMLLNSAANQIEPTHFELRVMRPN
jgi:hypothetical protein